MAIAVAIDKQVMAIGIAHLCLFMKSASIKMATVKIPNTKPNEIRPMRKIGLKLNIINSPFLI